MALLVGNNYIHGGTNTRNYMSKQHLVDVTEIFNSLNREKNRRYYKLAYLVILLFISLFWIIFSALEYEDD
ncbi:hypothetical protein GOBAR_AA31224 [Gossypium barbadense]|uniref:Uncharacterized protein n=1 Tax=Gossypium barbadense TaxID=3634 RepID=A0A2P5WEE4_GOSBA|nr:hypothetical protein GOBAR_AA31224 [Gossypium barbadense]